MVAILYLKVNLLRKNSKKYHTRQNTRKPRKTAKNKHRLTGDKNTAKPLINRVIQQPRWAQKRNQSTNPPRTRHTAATGHPPHATHPHPKHRASTHARHTMQPRALHASRTPHRRSRSLRTRTPNTQQSPQERCAHRVTSTQQAPTQAHKHAKVKAPPHTPTKERAGRRSHAHAAQCNAQH